MTPENFQIAVVSAGVIINIPILGYLAVLIHGIDKRMVRVETKLEALSNE